MQAPIQEPRVCVPWSGGAAHTTIGGVKREEQMMIVVGVDQSDGAKAALRFALDEARLRHVPLHAVHAWQFGFIGVGGFEGSLPVTGGDLGDFRRAAEADLASALNDVVGDVDDVDVRR